MNAVVEFMNKGNNCIIINLITLGAMFLFYVLLRKYIKEVTQ